VYCASFFKVELYGGGSRVAGTPDRNHIPLSLLLGGADMLTLRNAVRFLVCMTLVMGGFSALAADATGKWTWKMPGRNGAEGREVSLTLKQDGEKLTGKMGGGQNETEIKDGKIDKDGNLSFTVTRKRQDQEITQKYSGKLDGDTIKGKIEPQGGQGREREW
jgi:hypothetical protein